MSKEILARRIRKASRIEGEFLLRSGLTSNVYWDKYRFESDPQLLDWIGDEMDDTFRGYISECVVGMEMGGIPLAVVLGVKSGAKCLFVRKKPKAYGTANLVEGGFEVGAKALVVEDVITTAGQVCKSVKQMRKLGLVIDRVVCVIDRQQGGAEALHKIGCHLSPLFTMEDLEGCG